MIRPWQVWMYSLSLGVAALAFYGFWVSVLMHMVSGKHVPVLSQLPQSGEAELPLYLAMGTRTGAILMLAVLTLRTAAFPLRSAARLVRLKTRYSSLNQLLWLIALIATIPCLMIYLLIDAPIAELLSPWGALAAAGAVGLGWLAALSISLLLYDAAYIANTREDAFIAKLGWRATWQRIAVFAGRLAFYLVHPLLGVLYLLTALADRAGRRRAEVPA